MANVFAIDEVLAEPLSFALLGEPFEDLVALKQKRLYTKKRLKFMVCIVLIGGRGFLVMVNIVLCLYW